MIEKKKPSLADVSVKARPAAESYEEEEAEEGDLKAAASEMFAALKAGDEDAFATALRAAMKSC